MKPIIKLFGLLLLSNNAFAADNSNWQINFNKPVTQIMENTIWFHNDILLPVITIITIFVFLLMLWLVIRYRAKSNPVPSKTTHHVPLEIAWTLIPVLILAVIGFFSIDLLKYQDSEPKADVTIKAIGYQWYWAYEYPKEGVSEYSSYMLCPVNSSEKNGFEKKCVDDLKAKNLPHKLATDYPMVVPVNKNIRVLTTASDVIHSFAVPSFGIKKDAVPGRMNSIWFNAEQLGTYYGQCSELCGVNHAFMPITVKVVPQDIYDKWLVSAKAGNLDDGNKIIASYENSSKLASNQNINSIKSKIFMSLTVDGENVPVQVKDTMNNGGNNE